MKVLVVSGFLGAGKTTFINELSKHTNKQFAILENEYSSIGIDGDILKNTTNTDNIWEMTSGCICCSKQGDFAASVLTISNTSNPEYLIIEPTGVGMLSKVLSHIKKVEYERIQILAPITIIDGTSITRYRKEFGEIYDDQIKSASTIILSKMEKASQDEIDAVIEKIKTIKADAHIISNHYTKLPDSKWDELINTLHTGEILENTTIPENFDTFLLDNVSMFNPTELILLLEDIIRFKYGNIIRAKGSLKIGHTNLKFDLADRNYAILASDEDGTSNLVFIGKNINKTKLEKKFFKLNKHNKMRFKK